MSHGFRINESDKSVYSKFKQERSAIICLYVNVMRKKGGSTDLKKKDKI